jgi:3-phytase
MTLGTGTLVPAAAETAAVATAAADAADDPEIWVDARNPDRGVIFGTDKKAGLYAYDLTGKVLTFLPEGELNNVDLREGFVVDGKPMVLVAASDRVRGGAALFLLDPDTLALRKWADTPVPVSEPYGLCMAKRADAFIVVVIGKAGDVRQVRIDNVSGQAKATEERRFDVGSQSEGCVVDDVKGHLYIGEERKGIWRYALDPAGGNGRIQVAAAPGKELTPDVEGLTLIRDGAATYLIASSQGDSAFAVWRIDGETPAYAGRFSVGPSNGVDAVTGTDGVAALGGRVGPYAQGLVVVQDDMDTDGEAPSTQRQRQNYKLVGWAEVKKALAGR